MENCTGDHRCLICRRVTLKNLSTDSQTLVSNASLLQDFLSCFQINVLDSEVHDLSTSSQFCPTCEQFIAEWSNIQTQLTRRAAQLKSTLSTLLLSALELQEQNRNEDVTEIINNRIQNSQEIEPSLLLQHTVDGIRNELRKKYSVRVMLDKLPLPLVQNLDPLPVDDDNVDEPWNHGGYVADDCGEDEEYSPSGDPLNDAVTTGQCLVKITTEEEANCDDSNLQASIDPKEMNDKVRNSKSKTNGPSTWKSKHYAIINPLGANRFEYKGMSFQLNEEDQTYTCDACRFRSGPTIKSIRAHILHHLTRRDLTSRSDQHPVMIQDGPNRFKYNGFDITFNDQDQYYDCGACNSEHHASVHSILNHIRTFHYTPEDKIKFTAIKKSDTEWLYGGKHKIIKMEEKKFKCVSCGCTKAELHKVVAHIRNKHVEGSDEVISLPEKDSPSFNSSTQCSDHDMPCKSQLPLVLKLDSLPTDNATVDEAWDHWECGQNTELPVVPKIEPFSGRNDNDVEPWDHFGADNSDEEYLPSEDPLKDEVTPRTNASPKRKRKRSATDTTIIQLDPNTFKYKGMSFKRNEEDETYTCDKCGFRSGPTIRSIRGHIINHLTQRGRSATRTVMIPDGPNRFKYNGYDIRFNDQDQSYDCGTCNSDGYTSVTSIHYHIRNSHYTAEDKIKFTAVRKSNTEWLYGGKYKIIKVDEKRIKCVSCGCTKAELHKVVAHIRSKHVELEGPEKGIGLREKDIPSFNISTQCSDHAIFDKIPLPSVLKLDPLSTDNGTVDEAWDHWECDANIQLPVVPKFEPLLEGTDNNDEPWDHSEFGTDDSAEEYLPEEVELNDAETS